MSRVWYVTPRSLQWMVFTQGSAAISVERSRSQAIERAKILAREHGGGSIVVARRDGTSETLGASGVAE